MKDLTDRQLFCLDVIRGSIATRGYPPTLREIGEAMDIASTNGVNDHLRRLVSKKYIARNGLKSRAIVLLEKARARDDGSRPPTWGTFIARRRCMRCATFTFSDRCCKCKRGELEIA